ncbi:MAG TPA: hypothetical protein VF365_06210 [Candidatus Limnocylindria bacterium]
MSGTWLGRLPHLRGDPIGISRRQGYMAPPELITLIVAVVAWIVLLGSFTPDA